MRTMAFYLTSVLLLVLFVSTVAADVISVESDVTYMTKYVWRGQVLNPDPVVQPSVTLYHPSGLSLNVWGNIDATDYEGYPWSLTEVDYTISKDFYVGGNCVNVGVSHFTYPLVGYNPSTEVFASVCLGGELSPTVSVNYDIDQIDGMYASFGIGKDCAVRVAGRDIIPLTFSASIGYGSANYNNGYFGVNKSALNDITVGASLPIPAGERVTITPQVYYSTIIDSDLRNAITGGGGEPNNLYGGVSATWSY